MTFNFRKCGSRYENEVNKDSSLVPFSDETLELDLYHGI